METKLTLEEMIQDYQERKTSYEKQLRLLERSFMNAREREELCAELRNEIEQYELILPFYQDLNQVKQGTGSTETSYKVRMEQKYLTLLGWFSSLFQMEYFEVPSEALERTNRLVTRLRANLKQRQDWLMQRNQYHELDTEEYRAELAEYSKLYQERSEEEAQKEKYCQQYQGLKKQCQGHSFLYKQFHRSQCVSQEKELQNLFSLLQRRKSSIAMLDQRLAMFNGTLAVQEELESLQDQYAGTFEQEQMRLQKEYQQIQQQLSCDSLMQPVHRMAKLHSFFVVEAYSFFQKFHTNMQFLQKRNPKFYRQLKAMDPMNRQLLQKFYGSFRLRETQRTVVCHPQKPKPLVKRG